MDHVREDELQHHGVKGMKWGVRRYQNKDGSITPAGKKRYSSEHGDFYKKKDDYRLAKKAYNKAYSEAHSKAINAISPIKKRRKDNDQRWLDMFDKGKRVYESRIAYKQAKQNYKDVQKARRTKIGKTAVNTVLTSYGNLVNKKKP